MRQCNFGGACAGQANVDNWRLPQGRASAGIRPSQTSRLPPHFCPWLPASSRFRHHDHARPQGLAAGALLQPPAPCRQPPPAAVCFCPAAGSRRHATPMPGALMPPRASRAPHACAGAGRRPDGRGGAQRAHGPCQVGFSCPSAGCWAAGRAPGKSPRPAGWLLAFLALHLATLQAHAPPTAALCAACHPSRCPRGMAGQGGTGVEDAIPPRG